MKAKSIKRNSTEEIRLALQQNMVDGFKTTLEGRILSFGFMMNMGIEDIKKICNAPMVGIFSNGELGKITGENIEMHNLNTCCVALKKK